MRRTTTLTSLMFAVTLGVLPATTEAAVITFEGQFNTVYSTPITRLGFDIGNVSGDEQHFHELTSTLFGLPNNGTGVLQNDRDTRIFVAAAGGTMTRFHLSMVDVASALNNGPAVGLTISGFLDNVLVGTLTVGALGTGYTTVSGASLGPVDRLVFDGTGGAGGFVLDNLAVNEMAAVPEPMVLTMVGVGLAVAAARRRRGQGNSKFEVQSSNRRKAIFNL